MSKIRVMFIGQGPSGLAEDRVVNVFHFTGPGTYAEDEAAARSAVAGFYSFSAGQTFSVGSWLSPWVSRTAELRSYDLELPPDERPPTIEPLTLGVAAAGGYVEEAAVCLSYRGSPPYTQRRRGRLYIGPLRESAATAASSTTPARPSPDIIGDLGRAAEFLANSSGVTWCIRSSVPVENFVPIIGGYVDNAFDTQRRRGPDATSRTEWLAIGV